MTDALAPRSGDVVVADPAFGERAPGADPGEGALARAVFAPLPGTAEEARAVAEILPAAAVLTREKATEEAIKALHGPRLLHVATHGFFLGGERSQALASRGLELDEKRAAAIANPLLSSGLALAGANTRRDGKASGVLTALEVSALDSLGDQARRPLGLRDRRRRRRGRRRHRRPRARAGDGRRRERGDEPLEGRRRGDARSR